MKKFLATVAVALFALVGLGATQTAHADTDIWTQYNQDAKAMKGTFVIITCNFGKVVNDYTYYSDDVDASEDILFAIGKYQVTLPHTTLKRNHSYTFVMQKTEGGNQPNFDLAIDSVHFGYEEVVTGDDLKDHDIHAHAFHLNDNIKEGAATRIIGCFGSHRSGTEVLKGYLRDSQA